MSAQRSNLCRTKCSSTQGNRFPNDALKAESSWRCSPQKGHKYCSDLWINLVTSHPSSCLRMQIKVTMPYLFICFRGRQWQQLQQMPLWQQWPIGSIFWQKQLIWELCDCVKVREGGYAQLPGVVYANQLPSGTQRLNKFSPHYPTSQRLMDWSHWKVGQLQGILLFPCSGCRDSGYPCLSKSIKQLFWHMMCAWLPCIATAVWTCVQFMAGSLPEGTRDNIQCQSACSGQW